MKQSKRKGFTLAEVLITLAVIGVVAALAIPALLNNIGNAQFQSAVRKSSATLNQALQLRSARTGDDVRAVTDSAGLMAFFESELSVIQRDAATNTIFTADGMSYTFTRSGTCEASGAAADVSATAPCRVVIDVNGTGGPNLDSDAQGDFFDQYNFVITANSVVPRGNSFGTRALVE